MNLRLLTTLFLVASLAACQAPTDVATEVSANAAVASEAAASGPRGKDGIAESEAKAQQAKPVLQAPSANACAALPGKTFQSVGQYEMGRTANGIAKGHWLIGFDNRQYRWRYSDVVEMSDYQCAEGVITFFTSVGELRASGHFNSELGQLIVDGVEYALQP